MYGMMAALLMALVLGVVTWIDDTVNVFDAIGTYFGAICLVLLSINHFIINSGHKNKARNVRLNQILAVVKILSLVIWEVAYIPYCSNSIEVAAEIVSIFAFSAIIVVIVCVESRLDAYRLDREAAGWTEEAGYPDGYVHEYEKK